MGEMLPYYKVGKAQSGEALLPHRAGGQSLKLVGLLSRTSTISRASQQHGGDQTGQQQGGSTNISCLKGLCIYSEEKQLHNLFLSNFSKGFSATEAELYIQNCFPPITFRC